ncbi:aldose 1-epimerase [Gilvimarinus sp. DA14]|uniref:aldose 1-epimerase n=1 Tax=Gilvimarinus sp. DA14 TaxID=2956798 RepID=UPI0020B78429|nr:aldose epimerase [Gilvimarinus sp. DA14]UTF58718.1 aldose epimerase [Gilvimarinus sp. DA14]
MAGGEQQSGPLISESAPLVLEAGEARLSLEPGYGGMINELIVPTLHGARNVIAGIERSECASNPGYRGAVLFPFPNRLRDGRYHFGGRELMFAVNEADLNNALHGFLHRTPAKVAKQTTAGDISSATLVYAVDGSEPGYPFKAEVRMVYQLSAEGALRVEMMVENLDSQPIPVGLGWHPYYTLGESIDNCSLQLPEVERVLVDARLLPTGERVVDSRFHAAVNLAGVELDNCFVLGPEATQASAVFASESGGFGLQLWQQTGPRGLNFMQVYTSPDRKSLAVEPMSCGIDAFNTGEGLVVIKPGQVYSGVFGVRVYEV